VIVAGARVMAKHPPMSFFPADGPEDDCDRTPDTILVGPREMACLVRCR
jgi:hypothetical protein